MILEVWPKLLLEMYNSCLSKGIFPSRWKEQKLVLLRKEKKPLNEPSSYRPICLIDTMGKLLERMLLQRLETQVEERRGLSPRQYGFRKGRSTVDAILEVVNNAKKVKQGNWRKKGFCAVILLVVRNAFNSIKWERIMKALEKRETPEYPLRMVDTYLSDRKLEYGADQGKKEYAVTAGVPQGSVHGPFLWNVTYHDFLKIGLPERATLVGFADEVVMVVTADSARQLEIKANDCLNRANFWMQENGLQLAVQKTEAVLITDRRAFVPPELELGERRIEWNRSVTHLGIMTDAKYRKTSRDEEETAKQRNSC